MQDSLKVSMYLIQENNQASAEENVTFFTIQEPTSKKISALKSFIKKALKPKTVIKFSINSSNLGKMLLHVFSEP